MIADSDRTVEVNGNHYFPPNNVNPEYLEESRTHTDSELGEATYYHVKVHGDVKLDGAWSYPDPTDAGKEVRGYIAFSKEIKLEE